MLALLRRKILDRVANRVRRDLNYWTAEFSVVHVAGPRQTKLGDDEIGAVIYGCDTAFYLREVLDHHFSIGIRCCTYLDNGSQDNSISIAASYPNVTVLRTRKKLLHTAYENVLRRIAATRAMSGGWRLIIDADELFDYPHSDTCSLKDITQYLNANGMTGVVAQMLEMVPNGAVPKEAQNNFSAAIDCLDNYSITAARQMPYHEGINQHFYLSLNSLSDDGVKMYSGGIRNELFGEHCALSKHPLIRPGQGVVMSVQPHISTGLHVADFTCLLRHYKFAGDFVARERDRASANHAGGEARLRWRKLQGEKNFDFTVPEMFRFEDTNQLVDQRFLYIGPKAEKDLFEVRGFS